LEFREIWQKIQEDDIQYHEYQRLFWQANTDENEHLSYEEIREYIVQDNPGLDDTEYDIRAQELYSVMNFFKDDEKI